MEVVCCEARELVGAARPPGLRRTVASPSGRGRAGSGRIQEGGPSVFWRPTSVLRGPPMTHARLLEKPSHVAFKIKSTTPERRQNRKLATSALLTVCPSWRETATSSQDPRPRGSASALNKPPRQWARNSGAPSLVTHLVKPPSCTLTRKSELSAPTKSQAPRPPRSTGLSDTPASRWRGGLPSN